MLIQFGVKTFTRILPLPPLSRPWYTDEETAIWLPWDFNGQKHDSDIHKAMWTQIAEIDMVMHDFI